MASLPRSRIFRPDLVARLLLVLAVLWPVGWWSLDTGPENAVGRALAAEEATPDILGEVPEAPAQQRAQHLARLGVDGWHKADIRGQGVKIAILDTSFRGYRDYLGKALPAQVSVRSFRADGNLEARDSQHGLLCAEVLHAVAPDAELLLINWEPDDALSFLEAVRWARVQGARIISCSIIMPSWSDGEGGGPVHAALARLVGAGDAAGDPLFFASAGNTAQRHWSGPFCPDSRGYHQWSQGHTANTLRPWSKDRVAVELYGPVDADYDLQVFDAESGGLVGKNSVRWGFTGPISAIRKRGLDLLNPAKVQSPFSDRDLAKGGGCAVVRFLPLPDHAYHVRLRSRDRSVSADKFHLVVLGGSLERSAAPGSISFPGDGAGIEAVGAVDRDGRRLFYSSCGPNSPRPKPDFVAPVPFASMCRDRAFSGTSAAAPQAAGLAALWWSRNPGWTAQQVRRAMRETARDLGPAGHDWETGYGLIQLPSVKNGP